MFWALVMQLTIGGETHEFVLDKAPTRSACMAMLARTNDTPLYVLPTHVAKSARSLEAQSIHKGKGPIAAVGFVCEATRVEKR